MNPRFPFAVGKYNFDWEDPVLNDSKYNSPVPCTHGSNCFYHGKMGPNGVWINDFCRRVHPGEEGVGRKIFRARNKFERDQVRLFSDKNADGVLVRQTFYERTRLKMTWPQWCERMGWPVPGPKPVVNTNTVSQEELARRIANDPFPEREEDLTITFDDDEDDVVLPQPVMTEADWKQQIGTHLFHIIDGLINEASSRKVMRETGWTARSITTAKITGMIVEASSVQELLTLYNTPAELYETIMDCCEILQEAQNNIDRQNPLSLINCHLSRASVWGDCM